MHNIPPPKRRWIITSPPHFYYGWQTPYAWWFVSRPKLVRGSTTSSWNMGGKYQHPWGALGCSTLQTWQTTLPYREPGHKKHKKHTTSNMSRRRPTHQRLWPSLSMATSAMDLDLGAAAPYGSEAGAGCSVHSRHCRFSWLERQYRAHKKIESCTGLWP